MSCSSERLEGAPASSRTHATVNPCTLCAPLGAVLAAAGVERAMPLLHGAQGCATYIRRYIISHFREPMDVASSSFTEASAVMGGEGDFSRALDNIRRQYAPNLIAVGTTCLAETIGEDMRLMVLRYEGTRGKTLPIVYASTPSYRDGHVEGYHAMVLALVRALVEPCSESEAAGAPHAACTEQRHVNVLPPIVSPADLRHLRALVASYGLEPTILPDYSDTLDAPVSGQYQAMPSGGTPLERIRAMGSAAGTFDFTLPGVATGAGEVLQELGVARYCLGLPIGVQATDEFLRLLEQVSGRPMPEAMSQERGRLLDAYADGHKYVFGKRVAVYGDPEMVAAVAGFLVEVGARPVLCATGARNRALATALSSKLPGAVVDVLQDTDFASIEARSRELDVELMIGSSKGYRVARSNGIPLLRLGFPIHDRIGANRILSLGYRGTTALFDAMVNTLLERMQDQSSIGFSYL